ncbi:MAG: hypothetical protein Q9157_004792 [Trypethelium eluteriae]
MLPTDFVCIDGVAGVDCRPSTEDDEAKRSRGEFLKVAEEVEALRRGPGHDLGISWLGWLPASPAHHRAPSLLSHPSSLCITLTLAPCTPTKFGLLHGGITSTTLRPLALQVRLKWNYAIEFPSQHIENQATPFNLKSSDGLTLFAWHVLPLGLYEQHEAALRDQQPGVVSDIAKTLGFKLMTSDPESRLVINCHVAQGWRTDTYRVLTSSPSNLHIHLLTLDYRGFGVSTGSPTESGLISDGVELVNWAIHFARIPPERIVILGQSLGTAVATAVVHHFATNPSGPVSVLPAGAGGIGRPDGVTDDDSEQVGGRKDRVVFAGIVLVAAFSSLPVLLPTYRIAGFIPLLAPLSLFRLTRYVVDKILIDKWNSLERLQKYQRAVKGAYSYLALIHAFNDGDIPWTHSVDLFCGLVGAEDGREDDEMREEAERCYQKITEVRRSKRPDYFEWSEKDGRNVRLELVEYGGKTRCLRLMLATDAP